MRNNSSKPISSRGRNEDDENRKALENLQIPEPSESVDPSIYEGPMPDDENFEDYQSDYQDYLDVMNTPWHKGEPILDFDEFVAANYGPQTKKYDPDSDLSKFEFIPPGGIPNPATIATGIQTGIAVVQGVARGVHNIRAAAQQFREAVSDLKGELSGTVDVLSGGEGDSDPPPPGNHGLNGITHPFDVNRLNLNAKPIEVRLDTGIVSNTYGPYFDEATADRNILHLTGCALSFASTVFRSSDRLYIFFDNVVTFIFQNLAQMSVNFNINAASVLTTAKLISYFDALAGALQLYYFYGSILTYANNPNNHNLGMLTLREQMTAEDLNDLWQLKRLLEGFPIPPNLNTLCFYLMQTYRSSSLPGSDIIKINPIPFQTSVDTTYYKFTNLVTGQIAAYTTLLNTADNRAIASILSKVCPSWISNSLLAPIDIPLHDPEFTTLWCNLPSLSSSSSGVSTKVPSAATTSTSVTYNSYTDKLDGGIFGLTTIYDMATSRYYPALINHLVNSSYYTGGARSTNRLSFGVAPDGYMAFLPVVTYTDFAYSRGETHVITSTSSSFRKPGTEPALNVNTDAVRETAYALLEWIVSLDSIGAGAKELRNRPSPKASHVNEGGRSDFRDDKRRPNRYRTHKERGGK